MRKLEDRLRDRGWSKREIDQANRIFSKAKKKKSRFVLVPTWLIILLIFAIAIAGNIAISFFFVPLLIVLESSLLFLLLIITVALTMGVIFVTLINGAENIERKHHMFFATIMPATAVINFYFIVISSNKVVDQLAIHKIHQDPLVISIIYTVTFLLPYLYTLRNED